MRYREVDPETMPGLKSLSISNNPDILDEGLDMILTILKDDVWIKAIDMQNCGLTDVGGRAIIECLEMNKTLIMFDIKHNDKISEHLLNHVRRQLGVEPDILDTSGMVKLSAKDEAVLIRLNNYRSFINFFF